MKKSALFFFIAGLLLTGYNAAAQETVPDIPFSGKAAGSFIPSNWQIQYDVKSDFNKDKAMDEALLIRSDQQYMLLLLLREGQTFKRSFAGTFNSIEYISKLGIRNNTLQLVFDLPSYSAGHMISIYVRYQQEDWYIIGYTEESYDSYDERSGKSKNPSGTLKDVNLVTGETAIYTLRGSSKTLKQKYKQAKAPLLLLKNLNQLSVMNW